MSKTESPDALLTVCVQDLHAGEAMLAAKLPRVAKHARDPGLQARLADVIVAAERRTERLRSSGRDVDGPRNIWMRGILKDARRDTKSIAAGPLLDIAMVGAVRKAMAAALVSYETAIALADGAEQAMLVACRDEYRAADGDLAQVLAVLTG